MHLKVSERGNKTRYRSSARQKGLVVDYLDAD